MDDAFILLLLLVGGSLLLSPVLAIAALVKVGRLKETVTRLQKDLQRFQQGPAAQTESIPVSPIAPLSQAPESIRAEPAASPAPEEVPEEEPLASKAPTDTTVEEAAPDSEKQERLTLEEGTAAEETAEQDSTGESTTEERPLAARTATESTPPKASFEERMASRWLVWLGSLTVILGGVFLVKYGIDNDLISPALRITAGALLGLGLMVGGEWLRRRPLERAISAVKPNHVPPALTAAGVATLYGSLYAGFALYDLLAPLAAFVLLALVALAALGLSLLQGPFIAGVGLLGAFAVPALVSTGHPSAWALFSYLTFVSAAALGVYRYRNWRWLPWSILGGAALWEQIWLFDQPALGNEIALAFHQLTTLALFAAARFEAFRAPPLARQHPLDFPRLSPAVILLGSAALAIEVLALLATDSADYSTASLLGFALINALLLAAAWRVASLEGLAALAGLASFGLLAWWRFPYNITLPEVLTAGETVAGSFIGPILPPELTGYGLSALTAAVVFGGLGYRALWRSSTPAYWVCLSAGLPLASAALVSYRLSAVGAELAYGLIALSLAALTAWAAERVARHRHEAIKKPSGMEPALGLYALGTLGALGLAATLLLEDGWLTNALALLLPASAWIATRIEIRYLRPACLGLALVIALRLLLLNDFSGAPYFPEKTIDPVWLLLTYGIPALAFYGAARLFRQKADDLLVSILESGALALFVALVSLEIRSYAHGGLLGSGYDFLEMGLQAASWLATGTFLYARLDPAKPRPHLLWGSRILIGLAAAQVVLFHLLVNNPMNGSVDVGDWPLVNSLGLAYLVPALFGAGLYRLARDKGEELFAAGAGIFALVLTFFYLSFEVRHLFQGPFLRGGATSDAEGYAYSLVWLLYAGALLAGGILRQLPKLRHASLALILLVIGKVFLWDMAALTGLYRVGSFLGLGFALVAVGFLYQRYVFPIGRMEDETE